MNPYQAIKALEKAVKPEDKKDILKKADSQTMRQIIRRGMNPFLTYGVKACKFWEPCQHDEDFSYNLNVMYNLLDNLSARKWSPKDAPTAVLHATKQLTVAQQELLKKILAKDFKCGLTTLIVNEVYPRLLPVFTVAKPIAFKEEGIVYPLMAHPYMGGSRCLAFVHGNKNDVVYYNENGKIYQKFDLLTKELLGIAGTRCLVLDGEVTGIDKEDNMDIKFFVVDLNDIGNFMKRKPTKKYAERLDRLEGIFEEYNESGNRLQFNVRLHKGELCANKEEIHEFNKKCLSKNCKGITLRSLSAPYQFKSTSDWMCIAEEAKPEVKK